MGELRVSTGTPVVLDSSVAAKWFLTQEPGADVAAELLESHREGSIALVAPALLPLEVINALTRRGAALEDSRAAVAALDAVAVLLAPLDAWLLDQALAIAWEEPVALYDALFIALAVRLDAPLATADRRQAATRRCAVRLVG